MQAPSNSDNSQQHPLDTLTCLHSHEYVTMDNLGKISAFGKSFGYVADMFAHVLLGHCAITDRLTLFSKRFFHALCCEDTAVC